MTAEEPTEADWLEGRDPQTEQRRREAAEERGRAEPGKPVDRRAPEPDQS